MHPNDWQTMQRILVANLDTPAAIEPALALLQQLLPHAHVTVIAFQPDQPYETVLEVLRQGEFEAAIVLTAAGQSPYAIAYLCYLAGIPIRVGQSIEFGGGVLSECAKPPLDGDRHLDLLRAIGVQPALRPPLTPL